MEVGEFVVMTEELGRMAREAWCIQRCCAFAWAA